MEGKMKGFAAIVWTYPYMWRSIVFLKWYMQQKQKNLPTPTSTYAVIFLSNPVNYVSH